MTLKADILDLFERMNLVPSGGWAERHAQQWVELSIRAVGQKRPALPDEQRLYLESMGFWDLEPITDPEHDKWKVYSARQVDARARSLLGNMCAGLTEPHKLARRALFKRRVIEGLALREGGSNKGQRFMAEWRRDNDQQVNRCAFLAIPEGHQSYDIPEHVWNDGDAQARVVVNHECREIVLVKSNDWRGNDIAAVRAVVNDPASPEFGYTARLVMAVFLKDPEGYFSLEYPWHFLFLIENDLPASVVLVGKGEEVNEQANGWLDDPEALKSGIYENAIAFLNSWNPPKQRVEVASRFQELEQWVELIVAAIFHEKEATGVLLEQIQSAFDRIRTAIKEIDPGWRFPSGIAYRTNDYFIKIAEEPVEAMEEFGNVIDFQVLDIWVMNEHGLDALRQAEKARYAARARGAGR